MFLILWLFLINPVHAELIFEDELPKAEEMNYPENSIDRSKDMVIDNEKSDYEKDMDKEVDSRITERNNIKALMEEETEEK